MLNQRRIDQFSTRERQYQQSNSFYWNETDAPWAPEGYQLLSQATDMWPQSDGTLVPILTGVANLFQDYAPVSDQTWLCPGQTASDDDLFMWGTNHNSTAYPYLPVVERFLKPEVNKAAWQSTGDWIFERANLGLMVMAVWGPSSVCNRQNPDGTVSYQYSLKAVDIPTFWSLQYAPFTYIVAVPSLYKTPPPPVQSTYRQWVSSQIDGTQTLLIDWIPPQGSAPPPPEPAPAPAPGPAPVAGTAPSAETTSNVGAWIAGGIALLGLAYVIAD